jgi:hypothetical protein
MLMDNFRDIIPDVEDRRTFGEQAVAELRSGKCHQTFNMYAILIVVLMNSETVIGRKPSVGPDLS